MLTADTLAKGHLMTPSNLPFDLLLIEYKRHFYTTQTDATPK